MIPRANFDRVAKIYRWCEYLALGRTLERVRFARLPELANARSVLVLGDGDGRFLAQLLRRNPHAHVSAVDASPAMIALARRRAEQAGGANRVTFIQQDVRLFEPPQQYDAVTTHFLLDCFPTGELDAFLPRIARSLASEGMWVHSDFRVPRNAMRPFAWLYVSALYPAFRLLANVRMSALPDDAAALTRAGLRCRSQRTWLGGMLVSEIWRLR